MESRITGLEALEVYYMAARDLPLLLTIPLQRLNHNPLSLLDR